MSACNHEWRMVSTGMYERISACARCQDRKVETREDDTNHWYASGISPSEADQQLADSSKQAQRQIEATIQASADEARRCSRCHVGKPLSEFRETKGGGGHQKWCAKCYDDLAEQRQGEKQEKPQRCEAVTGTYATFGGGKQCRMAGRFEHEGHRYCGNHVKEARGEKIFKSKVAQVSSDFAPAQKSHNVAPPLALEVAQSLPSTQVEPPHSIPAPQGAPLLVVNGGTVHMSHGKVEIHFEGNLFALATHEMDFLSELWLLLQRYKLPEHATEAAA